MSAEVIATHESRDIALIKVDLPPDFDCQAIAIDDSDSILRGSEIAAFGFPLGDKIGSNIKVTTGVISAEPTAEKDDGMILLDIRVNPGNSGGPLCDRAGNVVGMVTAKTSGFFGVESYGYALPARELNEFLAAHLPKDSVRAEPRPMVEVRDWSRVDRHVSPAVLMILKTAP